MRSWPPSYPFLFAFAPIVGLFAGNYHEVLPVDLLRPVVIATAFVLATYAFNYAVVRDIRKSAFLTVVVVVVVVAYGPVRSLVPEEVLRTRDYLLSWLAIGLVAYVSCARYLRGTQTWLTNVTQALNWAGFAVVAGPLAVAGVSALSAPHVETTVDEAQQRVPGREQGSVVEASGQPDIYYIVLDGHGREDILRGRYGLHHVPLIEGLRRRGFYVADKAVSNYGWTHLSLAATLNLAYLDEYIPKYDSEQASADGFAAASRHFYSHIGDSELRQFLEGRGYRIMGNRSGYNVTRAFATREFALPFSLNEFEKALLGNMAIEPILSWFRISSDDRKHRGIRSTFERLGLVATMASPKFVFIHVVAPHSPFVFDAGGEQVRSSPYDRTPFHHEQMVMPGWAEWYRGGYASQVQGLGKYVEEAIDGILANSPRPPIIIVQGDHGPRLGLTDEVETSDVEERFGILNAFYLPGDAEKKLYPSISSVNTFRLILNEYFDANYPLLEDRSYLSLLDLDLVDVTDRVWPDG